MSNAITAGELQQQFATLFGAEEGVIWDLYTNADKDLLEKKLKFLIPDVDPAAQLEDRLTEDEKQKRIHGVRKINEELAEHRAKLFDALWAQKKYNNDDLIMSIIFVMVTPNVKNYTTYSLKQQTTFSCHPVFRVRKCKMRNNNKDSANCCALFVDVIGRVYQNWRDYLDNNSLPEGILLAPESGFYKFNNAYEVCLMAEPTPKASVGQKVLDGVNAAASFLKVTVATATLLGFILPKTRMLTIGSLVVALATSAWDVGRNIEELVDRVNHEESVSIANRKARLAWFGIAGGVIGMGAAHGLNLATLGGQNITLADHLTPYNINTLVQVMKELEMNNDVLTQILNKRDDECISVEEIMQLRASLVLFTHSIYNFKLVSELQVSEEGGTMQQFRTTLAGAQKKIYKNLGSNKGSGSAAIGGHGDVIREPGIIPDWNHWFGENAMRVAETYLKEVIDSEFLTNPQEFKSCILEIHDHLQKTAIDIIFNIAKSFLGQFTERLIPFEHVVWRIYIIVRTIYSNSPENVTGDSLKNQRKTIMAKLEKVYKKIILEEHNELCKNCQGCYSIVVVL